MNTQSSMENSHLKRTVIPSWALDRLNDIYVQNRENEFNGEVRIIFHRGRIKKILSITESITDAPDDSQKLRAVKKQVL